MTTYRRNQGLLVILVVCVVSLISVVHVNKITAGTLHVYQASFYGHNQVQTDHAAADIAKEIVKGADEVTRVEPDLKEDANVTGNGEGQIEEHGEKTGTGDKSPDTGVVPAVEELKEEPEPDPKEKEDMNNENDVKSTNDNDNSAIPTVNENSGSDAGNGAKRIAPGNHTNIPPPESRIGPNGEKGYVHNPKFLIEHPKPFTISDYEKDSLCLPPGKGLELPEGIAALRKIRNHIETSQEKRDVKVFCAVYTYSGGINHTNAASETWGKRCDGLLYASDHSDLETGHVHLPSNSRMGFQYRGMTQRSRTILAYLYDNFLNDYDFFHISGDDVFLIIENLKEFLASDMVQNYENTPNQYVFAGFLMNHRFSLRDYLGGGSGYTMSKKMLKAFVEGPLQTCSTTREGGAEDVFISECAQELNKKYWIDTRDSAGAHRYHQLSVQRHATFPNKRWGLSTNIIQQSMNWVNETFGFPPVYMDDYISNSSVVFHKHSPEEIRRLEILLYMDGNEVCGEMFTDKEAVDTADKSEGDINTGGTAGAGNEQQKDDNPEPPLDVTPSPESDENPPQLCPEPDPSVDAAFPTGFPQNLTYGKFKGRESQSTQPYIGSDVWTELVDNRRTFFIRPMDPGFPSMEQLRDWIRSRPHPITLIMSNQHDASWPVDLNNKTAYELILNEPNLHAVYATNARKLEEFPKLKPLPIGLKYNWRSTWLYSEDKGWIMKIYTSNLATTPEEAEILFNAENRTTTAWLRPFTNSNKRTQKYLRDNDALKMVRGYMCDVLNRTAPETGVPCPSPKTDHTQYFEDMKRHRFVLSPAGGGLDTHGTWEALLAGTIPIVPRSPLDPLFEDLPVWLVDSWEEVTDEAVRRVENELKGKTYKWEKLFASWWKEEIHRGLCTINA
eukprot:CAMPEP_0181100498 /NCGR_PEP_ID=MMETSP1071-20121207/13226_1 /TAXON_ID=35127 /ORGANISM="Thalassiosira sp., Strain NH16" /LENGTH=897 /DNA_ID=CAMNT_0023183233 /DNA_START=126 /DNA_END=2819 /DNA_ORIENTATION=+